MSRHWYWYIFAATKLSIQSKPELNMELSIIIIIFGVHCFSIGLASRQYRISKSKPFEFQRALDSVEPGDTIILQGGLYEGPYLTSRNGNQSHPISLTTSLLALNKTKITGKYSNSSVQNVGLTILGSYWKISFLEFSGFDTGISIQGTGSKLHTISISNVNTGIRIQGQNNSIQYCMLIAKKIGVKIDKGGDYTQLLFNSVNSSAEKGIEVDGDTCCGEMVFNDIPSKILIFGRSYSWNGHMINSSVSLGSKIVKNSNLFSYTIIITILVKKLL